MGLVLLVLQALLAHIHHIEHTAHEAHAADHQAFAVHTGQADGSRQRARPAEIRKGDRHSVCGICVHLQAHGDGIVPESPAEVIASVHGASATGLPPHARMGVIDAPTRCRGPPGRHGIG